MQGISNMDSEQRLQQVISAMQMEIRKLELENMGLRRRAGATLRKSATVPIMKEESKGRWQHAMKTTDFFLFPSQLRVESCASN